MFNRLVAPLQALVLFALASPAQAVWNPPYVTPLHPTASDTEIFNIVIGGCDGLFHHTDYPQITRNGNDIEVVFFGLHSDPGDDTCNIPIGLNAASFGSFPPGSYAVTGYLHYIDFFGSPQNLNLGTATFSVLAEPANAESAPATGPRALLCLVLLIAGAVAWRIHPTARHSH